MAQTLVEKVEVVELTKFGFKDQEGRYVGWSKLLKDAEKTPVVPGRSFEMELYIAESGKRYVNKVIKQLDTVRSVNSPNTKAVTLTVSPTSEIVKTEVKFNSGGAKKEDAPMTRDDWDAKDRRISRQGAIQAAVQAVGHLATDTSHIFQMAEALANQMLEFVNKK